MTSMHAHSWGNLVKKDDISWWNPLGKSCSHDPIKFLPKVLLILTCTVGWQKWPTDKNDLHSRTKSIEPEHFWTVTPVGMFYIFHIRTLTLTCKVEWSKWLTCLPSVKTIWSKKDDISRENALELKVVALILTSSKLPLNLLCDFLFFNKHDFPVFIKFDIQILQVILMSTNLSGLSKQIIPSFFWVRA